ncbi:MAG: isoprenylcysteine carboxylmethyltransferase family protein [Oscillospiraceae bacterium]|nr:isoprenylcysteine carboxylmethyltransferase family protein [Oscillospiraceae bacterium]
MKNFVKEGQKLPLYGVGPYIVYGMAALTAVGIVLCAYILKTGMLNSPWILIFRTAGGVIIVLGLVIWLIGALGSGMDENIAENRLKTDGVYAWVRNPMYTGWWFLFSGISLMWHNAWVLLTIAFNWGIMTVALKKTEEKWLQKLYGAEYEEYCKRVNRCIPWFPRKTDR